MTQYSNLFVVYDPIRENQPALERAADIAADTGASLHVFACIYMEIGAAADKSNQINGLLAQQQATLDLAVAPIRERGIAVSMELEWRAVVP